MAHWKVRGDGQLPLGTGCLPVSFFIRKVSIRGCQASPPWPGPAGRGLVLPLSREGVLLLPGVPVSTAGRNLQVQAARGGSVCRSGSRVGTCPPWPLSTLAHTPPLPVAFLGIEF